MLPETLTFVDVETTGMRPTWDRVIEIGMIRVENGQVVRKFESLINPGGYLPPEITSLTGIDSTQLEDAPSFWELKLDIAEMLEDSIFVAHNVRFDYSFLKNEFKRLEVPFSPKHFCTAKLSRLLYPRYGHHSVDALIDRFGFEVKNRHRALGDAQVIWEFYQKAQGETDTDRFEKALGLALKKPTVPLKLKEKDIENLPETPGVYIFYGDSQTPLYVGKSVNIRDRVKSHFSSDYLSGKEMQIAQQVTSIESLTTSGELGALILESELVKKLSPMYNRMLRYSQGVVVLKQVEDTKTGYWGIKMGDLGDVQISELNQILGVFRTKKAAKDHLINLAKEYSLCARLLGVESTLASCFGYRLGTCFGACQGKEMPLKYNLRFTEAFTAGKLKNWPFNGPIVITEKNTLDDTEEGFLVDNWCYLGKVKRRTAHDYEPVDQLQNEVRFDLDTYKIISAYVLNQKNQKNIKVLTTEWQKLSLNPVQT
jgi:DNA polymerase-3 subunit epsilon